MTPATHPVPVAAVGLGQWGPNLLRNLRQNPACRVVALADRDPARLAEFRPLHPDAALLDSAEAVAAHPDVRAVVLATPAGLHEAQVELLLRAGKDVLVEKPLAFSAAAARRLVQLARERGRILMVGHTFLFNAAVRRARELIQAGTLGRLQFIAAQRLSLGRIRQDCNALWNLAPHDVSILLHWVDALPTRVSARGLAFNERHVQEDLALCVLEFPGRLMASIHVGWLNPAKVRQMTIVGSEAMLVYDDVDRASPLTLYHQGVKEVPRHGADGSFEGYLLQVRSGPEERVAVPDVEPLSEEIAHFLQCVQARTEPLGSGEEAIRVTAVLEALDASLKDGGAGRAVVE